MTKRFHVAGALPALLALAAFWPAMRNGFVFDDSLYLGKDLPVTRGLTIDGIVWALTRFHASNWHPLTWVSHMLDVQWFGLEPAGHHLTSLLLHALNAFLLLRLLASMTRSLWRGTLVAVLFAVHPLRVESVTWIAERKDLLASCMMFLTVLAYLWHLRSPGTGRHRLAWLLFLFGLMAKPMVVTLPFVLLLLDYWPLGRWRGSVGGSRSIWGRLVLEKWPMWAMSFLSAAVTVAAQRSGDAVQSGVMRPFVFRMANGLYSYVRYITATTWPSGLAAYYPYPERRFLIWAGPVSLVLLALATAAVLRGSRRRPYLLTGWFWYLGVLLPVIGLIQVGDQGRADRYTYLPVIGLTIMVAWLIPEPGKRGRAAWAAAASGTVAVLMALTWSTIPYWKDNLTLFTRAAAVTRGNWLAEGLISQTLADLGRADEALEHYNRAMAINHALAREDRGIVESEIGGSEADLDRLSSLDRARMDAAAHLKLARGLVERGKPEYALEHYRRAIALNPALSDARFNLAFLLEKMSRQNEAVEAYREALRVNPWSAPGHNRLGMLLLARGDREEAVTHFRYSLWMKPDQPEVRENLERALREIGTGERP